MTSMTSILNLRCEYRSNPLGIDITRPRLSWQMHSDRPGAKQIAYRIVAADCLEKLAESANLWDSGRIESDQSTHVIYDGDELASRQRVYWRVTIWDEVGNAIQSESAWFEMGLLHRSDWHAEWIGPALHGGAYTNVPVPFFRKPFDINQPIKSARLYVSALGLHDCTLNGRAVSQDVFAPGWTDYNVRVQYNVYDVAELLHEGKNVLGSPLGDGWAVGHVGMGPRQYYFKQPRFFAQLEITHTNGDRVTVVSDRTWRHQYGPLLASDMMQGEAYDATMEMTGWDTAEFDASSWLPVEHFEDTGILITATNGPTVRRSGEIYPISDPDIKQEVVRTRAIFDMGQNMVGWIRLQASAPKGTNIILRFAEVLDENGDLYTANLRSARATDHYTFKGEGIEIWEPKFTFHGFRYVEITGPLENITRDTVTGIVLHSEMEQTGEFTCSDPLLNQLQSNILWGQKGNFLEVPTDCPQRDERQGWTGDAQVFLRTAAFNMDVSSFMSKWILDMSDAQTEVGSMPAVIPISSNLKDGGPAWADATIICPWIIYLSYGDKGILEKHYGMMSRFMEFIIKGSPQYIRCAPDYAGWPGFGDWLSINAPTLRELIGTAFFAHDARLMVQIATILGYEEDAAHYEQLEAKIKAAFVDRYLVGGGLKIEAESSKMQKQIDRANHQSKGLLQAVDYGEITSEVFNTDLVEPTQTSYVLALNFDMLPESLRPVATAELVADIERRGMHLSTGFVGTSYLPHVLSNNGRIDIAYALLHQKTWPSWLYSVTQGATTIWERWDGWTEESGFQSAHMNSFNHYSYGAIGAWMYSTIAGINLDPEQPAYKHVILRPQPGGGLSHARGEVKSNYGLVVSEWKIDKDKGDFVWNIVVPPNTTATAYPPREMEQQVKLNGQLVTASMHQLEPGSHQIVVSQ